MTADYSGVDPKLAFAQWVDGNVSLHPLRTHEPPRLRDSPLCQAPTA